MAGLGVKETLVSGGPRTPPSTHHPVTLKSPVKVQGQQTEQRPRRPCQPHARIYLLFLPSGCCSIKNLQGFYHILKPWLVWDWYIEGWVVAVEGQATCKGLIRRGPSHHGVNVKWLHPPGSSSTFFSLTHPDILLQWPASLINAGESQALVKLAPAAHAFKGGCWVTGCGVKCWPVIFPGAWRNALPPNNEGEGWSQVFLLWEMKLMLLVNWYFLNCSFAGDGVITHCDLLQYLALTCMLRDKWFNGLTCIY